MSVNIMGCPNCNKGAWITLWSFFMQTIIVGIGMSYGVMHMEFLDYFNESSSKTSLIGSINIGVSHMTGPLISAVCCYIGLRPAIMLGSVLTSIGFLASAFAPSVDVLYVTYGLLTGIGMGFVYIPTIGVISSYFEENQRKRDIALCLASTGIGIGVLIFPPVLERLVNQLTWRGCLWLCSAFALQVSVFAALSPPKHHKNTLPPAEVPFLGSSTILDKLPYEKNPPKHTLNLELLKNWKFLVILAGECVWNMTNCIIMTILPDYARKQGHFNLKVCMLLSTFGILGTLGRILMAISNRWPYFNSKKIVIISVANFFSALCILLLPLNSSYVYLVTIAGIFGLCYGCKYAILTCLMASMFGSDRSTACVGYLSVAVGIGQLSGPPLGGIILDTTGWYQGVFYFAGGLAFFSFIIYGPLMYTNITKKEKMVNGYSFSSVEVKEDGGHLVGTNGITKKV